MLQKSSLFRLQVTLVLCTDFSVSFENEQCQNNAAAKLIQLKHLSKDPPVSFLPVDLSKNSFHKKAKKSLHQVNNIFLRRFSERPDPGPLVAFLSVSVQFQNVETNHSGVALSLHHCSATISELFTLT